MALHADTLYRTGRYLDEGIDSIQQQLEVADRSGEQMNMGTRLLVTGNKLEALKATLQVFCSAIYAGLVDQTKKQQVDSKLGFIQSVITDKEWARKYINNTPTVGVITILSKVKNDVKEAAVSVLRDIKEHM